jgi:hypothetical protein
VLEQAAAETHLSPDFCDTAYHAMERLGQRNYSALVLDLDHPGVKSAIEMTHLLPAAERPVVFAMVSPRMHVATAYECGVNFVLYKPLHLEQVLRSLRAARGFMPAERRLSARHGVRHLVHFDIPGEACHPALLLEVSTTGMSVQTTGAITLSESVPFRLQLPQGPAVKGSAEVIWTDSTGRVGLMFSGIAAQTRENIQTWLATQKKGHHRRKPELVYDASFASV